MFLFLIWSRNYETGESSFRNILGKGREIEDKRVNFKNRRIVLPETRWKGMEGTSTGYRQRMNLVLHLSLKSQSSSLPRPMLIKVLSKSYVEYIPFPFYYQP